MAEYITKEQALMQLTGLFNDDTPLVKYVSLVNSRLNNLPPADVVERSTMKLLCIEYLSKCNCCDECCAEFFCIENQLRTEKRDCVNNLEMYFMQRNVGE